MNKPPEHYEFNFTLTELIDVTEALEVRRRAIEGQLSQAYADGKERKQRALHVSLQRITDVIDMLSVPVEQVASAMDEWPWEHDDVETTDDLDWDSDDHKDALYKN